MSNWLCAALGVAVGAIGLVACDAASPPSAAVSQSVESESQPGSEVTGETEPVSASEALPAGEPAPAVGRPAESEKAAESEAAAAPEAIAAGKAIAAAMREEDPFARARKLAALLPTLGPEATPALKGALEAPDRDFGATEFELLVRAWATHQPADAGRWSAWKSPENYRAIAVLASFTVWAEADPQAVLAAMRDSGAQVRDVHRAMMIGLVRGWYKKDPTELEEYIRSLPRSFDRQRAIATFIRATIRDQGPEAAMRWAESVSEDDVAYKVAVYSQVGAVLPLFDKEAGLRWCEAHCEGRFGKNLRSIIVSRLAQYDGPSTLAWISAMPEGPKRDDAVRDAFRAWATIDYKEALAWATAQMAGGVEPWLRPILQSYALLLLRDSPAEAVKWAEQIESDIERETTLIRLARGWRSVDKAAAEAWLLESPLSEKAREQVRGPKPAPEPVPAS